MSEIDHADLAVALVFGDAEASAHLRDAVQAIGAQIVCEAPVNALDAAHISDSGASVVLVNLDDGVGELLDQVYDTLDESRFRVVFNDPDISYGLSGWEHARWLRHLAAKLRDDGNIDPPRPPDAVPPDSPADAAADAWVNEALGVLGEGAVDDANRVADAIDAPAIDLDLEVDDATVAEPTSPIDINADDATEAFDLDLGLELEAVDEAPTDVESASATLADVTGIDAGLDDEAAESVAELDAGLNLADEAASLEAGLPEVGFTLDDTEAWLDDDTDEAQPASVGEPIAAMSTAEPDFDLDTLEAEVNAAFGSDALAALDEAGNEPAKAAVVPGFDEVVTEDPDAGLVDLDAALAPAPSPVDAPAAVTETQGLELADEDAPPPPAAPAPEAPAFSSFNIDHLALLDMEPEVPDLPAREAVEHRLEIDRRSLEKARAAEAEAAAEDEDESEQDAPADGEPVADASQPDPADASEFGIELMTAAEFLAPDAPEDIVGSEITAPERISLDEAVAPRMHDEEDVPVAAAAPQPLRRVIVLGASIGGPDAVREFLSALPPRFPATFLLVQHIGSEFVNLMVNQLGKASALPVRVPGSGERALSGEVLVVPHGQRLRLPRSGEVELLPIAGGGGHDPSINDTMTMAAENFGEDAMAVVFSGMAGDAVSGALEIAARGGVVWAQDPASCVVSTMVDGVISAGVARFVGTPRALGENLVETLGSEANP